MTIIHDNAYNDYSKLHVIYSKELFGIKIKLFKIHLLDLRHLKTHALRNFVLFSL